MNIDHKYYILETPKERTDHNASQDDILIKNSTVKPIEQNRVKEIVNAMFDDHEYSGLLEEM